MARYSSHTATFSGFILVTNWVNRYAGLPFVSRGREQSGVDCWGLVRLIYAKELQIELPTYGEISAHDLAEVARNIDAGKDGETWSEVSTTEIKPFDVCVMKFAGSRRVGHVGVVVNSKNIIHIEKGIDAAIVPLAHFTIRERIECFRRHKTAKY